MQTLLCEVFGNKIYITLDQMRISVTNYIESFGRVGNYTLVFAHDCQSHSCKDNDCPWNRAIKQSITFYDFLCYNTSKQSFLTQLNITFDILHCTLYLRDKILETSLECKNVFWTSLECSLEICAKNYNNHFDYNKYSKYAYVKNEKLSINDFSK